MIRRPPRSTRVRSSAASDVYKRQVGVDLGSGPAGLYRYCVRNRISPMRIRAIRKRLSMERPSPGGAGLLFGFELGSAIRFILRVLLGASSPIVPDRSRLREAGGSAADALSLI